MSKKQICPRPEPQQLLDEVQVRLAEPQELPRIQSLLRRHHYLGSIRPVGERVFYVAVDKQGRWVGVLVFCAAARHLRHREQWIGWDHEQRRRRLALVVNHARYLLIPHRTVPNLGSRVLKLALAMVEDKVAPRCTQRVEQIRPLTQHFKQVPEYRGRVESYPRWSLLSLVACAVLCGAQRGPKALAAFAKKLSQAQRRVLGIRPLANGWYPGPSQSTFFRALQAVDAAAVDRAVLDFQAQVRGQPAKAELVVLDGKQPSHRVGCSSASLAWRWSALR